MHAVRERATSQRRRPRLARTSESREDVSSDETRRHAFFARDDVSRAWQVVAPRWRSARARAAPLATFEDMRTNVSACVDAASLASALLVTRTMASASRCRAWTRVNTRCRPSTSCRRRNPSSAWRRDHAAPRGRRRAARCRSSAAGPAARPPAAGGPSCSLQESRAALASFVRRLAPGDGTCPSSTSTSPTTRSLYRCEADPGVQTRRSRCSSARRAADHRRSERATDASRWLVGCEGGHVQYIDATAGKALPLFTSCSCKPSRLRS